jgi:hypothetical protein
MLRQLGGKSFAAGIDEALFGPVAPGGETAGAQNGTGGEKFSAAETQGSSDYVGESLI